MSNEENKIIDPLDPNFKYEDLNGSEEQMIVVDKEIVEGLSTVDIQVDDAMARPSKKIQRMLLVEWMALPSQFRKPKTLKDFCKKYDLDMQSVNIWKKDDDFIKEVQNLRKKNLIEQSGDVLDALTERAKKGDPAAVKLYFQYVENFMEGSKHEVSGTLADLMKEIGTGK